MPRTPTVPERLDRALEQILAGLSPSAAAATAGFDAPGRTLLETADRVRAGLPLPPVAPRFEARLGARLAAAASGDPVAWALRHPGRLIVTGAVGSAVGVGVTAYAVWRSTRRSSTGRFLHR
jgi:hypothetical protein